MKRIRTLKSRMVFVTLLAAAPVLICLFAVNMRSRDNMRAEILREYEAEMMAGAARMDVLLNMLEEMLVNFPLNNPDLRTVAYAKELDSDFWLTNQRLMNQLNNMSKASVAEFKPFIYFPDKDIFYNFLENEELADRIQSSLDDWDRPAGWEWIDAGEEYFVYILDYDRYYLGIWISCDDICSFLDMKDTDGSNYAFEPAKLSGEEAVTSASGKSGKQAFAQYYAAAYCSRPGCSLVRYLDAEIIEKELPKVTDGFLWVLLLLILVFAAYFWGIYRWLIFPMEKMRRSMELIEAGDVKYRIPMEENSSAELVSVTEQFNAMMDQLDRLQYEIYQGRLERQEVELEYLSRQIQPHFILNTLNTLYNYSESDVRTAQDIIRLVSQYYRYVVNVNSRYVQLGQELEHIGNYLKLQKIRYPSAFDYEILCDEALDIVPIPPFLVESFISNAIKYGRKAGEMVHISITVEELQRFQICIRISDTGEGFSEDMLDILGEYLETGDTSELGGVGIKNSIERLRLIYQDRAEIRFYNRESGGAVVEIRIMVSRPEEGEE